MFNTENTERCGHPGQSIGGRAGTCFAETVSDYALNVCFAQGLEERIEAEDLAVIRELLAEDPRPSYQDDPARIYHMDYAQYSLSFTVENGTLTVTKIETNGAKKK